MLQSAILYSLVTENKHFVSFEYIRIIEKRSKRKFDDIFHNRILAFFLNVHTFDTL